MKPENIIIALEKFFFEIIGQLLPGFLLLVGLYFILPESISKSFKPTTELGNWTIIGVSYVFGGALTTFGSYMFIPLYLKISKSKILSWVFTKRMNDTLKTNKEVDENLVVSAPYKKVLSKFDKETKTSTIRNVAMSSIEQVDKETTIRFMFLSLLSQGVASSLALLAIAFSVCLFISHGLSLVSALQVMVVLLIVFFLALPFVLREREFYDRARRLPIDSFFALLESKNHERIPSKNKKVVYLSGGHHSGWQERIKNSVQQFDYLDPSKTGMTNPKLYTEWDLEAVRNSDIVFAYMESSNPSGYGLSLEVGYAAARNKFIILVDEKSTATPEIASYLKIVRETANVVFENLDEGITYLNSLSN